MNTSGGFWTPPGQGIRPPDGHAFDWKVPQDASRPLAFNVAMRAGDLLFARQLAAAMPADSPDKFESHARIELADGNMTKALEIAKEAARRFADNEQFRDMVQQMQDGTF